jgi:hypothetical protein
MSYHTPGPWKHDEMWGLIKYGRTEICALHSGNAANARLIAAAPELLEALNQTVSSLEYWFKRNGDPEGANSLMMQNARAAIAKATGKE